MVKFKSQEDKYRDKICIFDYKNKIEHLFKVATFIFYNIPQSILHGVTNNMQVCWLLIFVYLLTKISRDFQVFKTAAIHY